ncbi:MAG: hypothetical protein HONBIEJF_01668 [Fimbriimonadaceae bacterium]|nr:hypothetical protein [Fimbriimonadaceae bacterium]
MPTLTFLDTIELGRFGALCAQTVHAEPHADSIKVGSESAVIAQSTELSKNLQKRLLCDIFCLMCIPKNILGCPYQPAPVARNNHREGGFVACPASSEPIRLIIEYLCRVLR